MVIYMRVIERLNIVYSLPQEQWSASSVQRVLLRQEEPDFMIALHFALAAWAT